MPTYTETQKAVMRRNARKKFYKELDTYLIEKGEVPLIAVSIHPDTNLLSVFYRNIELSKVPDILKHISENLIK